MKQPFILSTFILAGFLLYGEIAMGFTLTSNAFNNGQSIPTLYTCDGKDATPTLSWSTPPKGTQSFAIIADDPDAPLKTWVHWVVFNIPANISQWPSNGITAIDGNNSWKQTGYRGPCPPLGKDHHYIFTIYALDTLINLPSGASADEVQKAIKNHILEQTTLIGIYHRS